MYNCGAISVGSRGCGRYFVFYFPLYRLRNLLGPDNNNSEHSCICMSVMWTLNMIIGTDIAPPLVWRSSRHCTCYLALFSVLQYTNSASASFRQFSHFQVCQSQTPTFRFHPSASFSPTSVSDPFSSSTFHQPSIGLLWCKASLQVYL